MLAEGVDEHEGHVPGLLQQMGGHTEAQIGDLAVKQEDDGPIELASGNGLKQLSYYFGLLGR